jgi:GNAT superfamily N-acetyltransferase
MKTDYEIVAYQQSMKNQVAELAKHLWSTDSAQNASYLEWKYERNPYRETPLIYIALCRGKVVGMRGMFGLKWEFGNPVKTFPGLYPDDFVILPEHRNRGLVTKIMKGAMLDVEKRGYTYVFNLSAGDITRVASLAMGWRSAGSMRVHCRRSGQTNRFRHIRDILKKNELLRRFAKHVSFRPWAPKKLGVDDLIARKGNLSRKTDSHIVVERTARPAEMEKLVSRIEYDGRIRHVRDKHYLYWRFQNPLHRYLFIYWEEAELEGYLVLQEYISDLAGRVGFNIVDWEATSSSVRAGLLQKAIALCSCTELNIWTATLPAETMSLLKENGFRPAEESAGVAQSATCLLVRPVRDDLLETDWFLDDYRLLDMASWDIRMIYSMHG